MRRRLRPHRAPVVAAVGVELQVRHVGPMAFQHLHRLERGRDVAGRAEVVAVQVQRMRQPQVVDDLRQAGDDLRRRQLAVAFDRSDISLASLPHFQAATPPGLTAFTP